jgi:ribulose 1,5-bisphosphate synthetase/thiazole synthase
MTSAIDVIVTGADQSGLAAARAKAPVSVGV